MEKGHGTDWEGAGGRHVGCSSGIYLNWVVVTWVYVFVQIHWAVHLRFVCFTIRVLYFNEKIKGKGLFGKELGVGFGIMSGQ